MGYNNKEYKDIIVRKKCLNMKDVIAAIIQDGTKVFIAQRAEGQTLAGYWEFPGGKPEVGETPEACILREMDEEFGISIDVLEYFGESIYAYETWVIRLLAYRCRFVSGVIQCTVHSAFHWAEIDSLGEYDFAPADIPLIEKLQGIEK